MEEQSFEETIDFKSLRAKFQDGTAANHITSKPSIPEKPKNIPTSGSRLSLIASINNAVEQKMAIMPRVVFKDEMKEKTPFGRAISCVKHPVVNADVLPPKDQNQKKKANIEKQASADKNLPVVLPTPSENNLDKQKSLPTKDPLSLKSTKAEELEKEPSEVSKPATDRAPTPEQPVTMGLATAVESSNLENGPLPQKSTSSLPQKSPSTMPSKSSSPMPSKSSSPQLSKSSSPQLPKSSSPQLPKSSSPQLPKSSSPQLPKSSSPQLPKSSSPQLPKSSSPQLPTSSSPLLSKSGSPFPPRGPSPLPQTSNYERPATPTSAKDNVEVLAVGTKTPPCDLRVLKALKKAKQKSPSAPTEEQESPESIPPENAETPEKSIPAHLFPELPPVDYDDHGKEVLPDRPSSLAVTFSVPIYSTINAQRQRQASPASPGSSTTPTKKPLPDFPSLGPAPQKPSRPPMVDLSPYEEINPESALKELTPACPPHEMLHASAPEQDHNHSGAPEIETPRFLDPQNYEFQPPDENVLEYGDEEHWHTNHETQHYLYEDQAPEHENPDAENVGTGHADFVVPESDLILYKDLNSQQGPQQDDSFHESTAVNGDNDSNSKSRKGQNGRKRKGHPKNPYAETKPTNEDARKSWFYSRNEKADQKANPASPEDKELKKKEKQRLEKERKEQKEKEKKENEMKKKFKITGQEEPMYQATVIVESKWRKNDLPVKSGDIVSIIRTTNCPKGKWLARDSNNTYGYISLKNVELDIKEMVVMGKKASQAAGRPIMDGESFSTGSRSPNNYSMYNASFSEDSEEWTGDEDELTSPTECRDNSRPVSMHDLPPNASLQPSQYQDECDIQTSQQALQKLATFFQKQGETAEVTPEDTTSACETPNFRQPADEHMWQAQQEVEAVISDMPILPPPELYAD